MRSPADRQGSEGDCTPPLGDLRAWARRIQRNEALDASVGGALRAADRSSARLPLDLKNEAGREALLQRGRTGETPIVDQVETLERVTETHDWGVFERAGDL